MKIEISFNAPKLPRRYHFLFSSIVKSALETSAPELQKQLYYYGDKPNKRIKQFTGSIFLNSYKLDGEIFYVHSDARMTVSSPDTEFLFHLYNGFIQKQEYRHKDFHLNVNHVQIVKEKLPTKNKVLFKTLSPIVVRNKSGRFLSINDENYEKEFNYICNEIIKSYTGNELNAPILFHPVLMKKQVVQLQHDSFKKLNDQSILYVQCYNGTFILEGDAADLKILTMSGVGHRRNIFFGNIEMIDE